MPDIRCFNFQTTSGNIYEVVIKRNADATLTGVGRLVGANRFDGAPTFDNTETSFVVITALVGTVFGPAARLDSYLSRSAMYDASNPAAGGAALSTLLT